ncbi:MAG: NAD(P)-binding protein [Streptosporangiales bacterium]|nr:NAD(P)-binding protein [Streptosporangiales bacterium]
MSSTGLRAVIVGGGIGGVAAAMALTRVHFDVRVYEQARQLTEVGAGVVLAPNSLRLLEGLGLGDEISRWGIRLTDTRLCQADGRVAVHDPDRFSRPGERVGIHRADLLTMLADHLPDGVVLPGHRCVGFTQDDDHAVVSFDNGESVEADVVIGADGIHSTLQGYVVEPSEPVFSGVVAYRGVIPAEQVPSWPAGTMRLWMGDGKHFLVFPVRAGQLLNYVGFVPSDTQMRESWSAPGDPVALATEFAGWDPVIGAIIDAIGTTGFRWGLYDRAPLHRWGQGRLTLLGDAAHPMLPHMGQGVNQAIEDGIALATMLDAVGRSDVPKALAAYETLRRDRTARIQEGSRLNGVSYDASGAVHGGRDRESGGGLQNRRWIYDYDVEAEAAPVAAALRAGG